MILKGSVRNGALDLSLHLSNEIDNEKVYVAGLRGTASENIFEAFREWEVIAQQSHAKQSFYSLSINPDKSQRDWTDKEWQRAINHIEKNLGLEGQPRAIVYHDKAGASDGNIRKHCHVVWSRINGKTLKAISHSFDYYTLQRCTKELAREFGLKINYKTGKERINDRAYDHAKSHGENRDVDTSEVRKETITGLWQKHTKPKEFDIALKNAGYIIAQGQRRAFVVIDKDNQIHSLARQISGANTKQIKDRLGSADSYPNIGEAKDQHKAKILSASSVVKKVRTDLTREQKLYAKLKRMAGRTDTLSHARRKKLSRQKTSTKIRHQEERNLLHDQQQAQTKEVMKQRSKARSMGLTHNLRTVFGYELFIKWKHAHQDRRRIQEFATERQNLIQSQKLETNRLNRRLDIIEKQERREATSYNRLAKKLNLEHKKSRTQIRREQLRKPNSEFERSLG